MIRVRWIYQSPENRKEVLDMNQFKNLTERYCPKFQGNVPLENIYDENGKATPRCLFSYKCDKLDCEKHLSTNENNQ